MWAQDMPQINNFQSLFRGNVALLLQLGESRDISLPLRSNIGARLTQG